MQYIKLTIPGNFWDSHIYSSKLYLFDIDSSVSILDWNLLISSLRVDDALLFALQCAFTNSEWLYGPKFKILFKDREIRDLIKSKFDRLAKLDLVVDRDTINYCLKKRRTFNNPFPFSDLSIYKNYIYTSSTEGIHFNRLSSGVNKARSQPKQLWDCPAVSIAASYSNLATATGPDGLYRVSLYDESGAHRETDVAEQVSTEDCIHCNWLDTNIYGSSHYGRSCFANFNAASSNYIEPTNGHRQNPIFEAFDPDPSDHKDTLRSKTKLVLNNRIFSDGIFKSTGYSWGSHDKLYLTQNAKIQVVKVQTQTQKRDLNFSKLEGRSLDMPFGDVVSGAVAPFGTVIECDSGIMLINSDGDTIYFGDEPVRFRVFNRSTHYENQLHIIYDDRLEIYSFNGDYFVDQASKVFGYTAYV